MDVDFSTGNSGNLLQPAVIKLGPGCQQEGAFCQHLGPEIAPRIYSIFPDGYVMEALESAPRTDDLLLRIEQALDEWVWPRKDLPISTDESWQNKLTKYSIDAPDWAVETDPCLVHGDPTASNALHRNGKIILCDPRPPRDFIPQCMETDCGRILQSALGWEVIAYNAPFVRFIPPKFTHWPKIMRAATFWCGAAAARIQYLEMSRARRPHILEWCRKTRDFCNV